MNPDKESILRRALSEPVTDDLWGRLSQGSIRAFAERDPEMKRIADELLASSRAELDLHLEGAGVSGHETRAAHLGRLLSRTATAVKELAKQSGGINRLGERLVAVGPAAGSVRVVLRAPATHQTTGGTFPASDSESLESTAMRHLTALILQAEDENAPLVSSMQALRGEARVAVRRVAQTVVDGRWRVEGELRTKGRETVALRLSEAGAQRMVAAAKLTDVEAVVEEWEGLVDGWTWSTGVIRFAPVGRASFDASVPLESQDDIAHASADRRHMIATFNVIVTYPTGDQGSARRSYALVSWQDILGGDRLPFDNESPGGPTP